MNPDIESILDAVHAAAVAADFARLASLLPLLAAAEKGLANRPAVEMHTLRAKAERNSRCLRAAIAGVKAARRRLAEISDASRGLTTYDRVGVKATLPAASPNLRRV